jgi:tRNA(fMet)-specific endonuclease VapC
MAIILDADVIISGEKGVFDLQRWLVSRAEDQFELAAITIAELWHGVERASAGHRAQRQRYLEAVMGALPVVPYTAQTAYHHVRIWATLESAGKTIGPYDLIVAATAFERGGIVATFNKRHFSQVKGLAVIQPN